MPARPRKCCGKKIRFTPMKVSQKCSLPRRLVVEVSAHLREPVVEAAEDGEHRAEREHVVEVRDDEIGVVQHVVETGIGELHAGDAAEREQEDEADRPQHRRLELDRAAPHGGDPGEDLDAGRHRDDHGRGDEIGLRVERQADRVHVVRPHDEADEADRDHGIGHADIAEDRLLREGRDDLADDAEARQDQDVDLAGGRRTRRGAGRAPGRRRLPG